MVRVLQVVTNMEKGGIENMLMNFYRKIDRTKVQFDFLIHDPKKADFEDEIEEMGGRIYRTPERNMKNFGNYLRGLDDFFRQHKEYKIVHSHINTMSVFVLQSAKKNGVPVRIAHSHTAETEKGKKKALKDLFRSNINRVCTDRFACGEKAGRYMFSDKYFDKGLVTVVNNGIDCESFSFNEEKRNEIREKYSFGDDLVIGHVGRFDEYKNQGFLIEILDCLKKNEVKAKLLLLGDGELLNEIKEKAQRLGLTDSVVFAGVVPDVYNYLNAMDVFVFPSLFEGLGMVSVEAQANGLTVISSDAVPKESDLTGLVEFLPLSLGAKAWAERIKSRMPYQRQDKTVLIREAGYDSETSAKFLENFYLEKAKEN